MRSVLKSWGHGNGGVAAVEFALVGFPFVLMIIGIIELALLFTTQSVLHEAAFTASRLIRTGQLQQSSAGGQQQMFEDAVCNFAKRLIPCNEIQYEVQVMPTFSDAGDNEPKFDKDGNLITSGFDPGGENDIVLIRVMYNYPIKTPLMQPFLATTGNRRALFSTIVLQTEPYQEDD